MRAGLTMAVIGVTAAGLVGASAATATVGTFEGYNALVVQPENSWGWDSAVFGALEERGFRVTYGALPDSAAALSRFDLVALSIKRDLTPPEDAALREYVRSGGALYGSWGGPFGASEFLRDVCRVQSWRSLHLMQMRLLESPLAAGIAARDVAFAQRAGHQTAAADGWEIVSLHPGEGGIPVAEDAEGDALGVLAQCGEGRAAVLGFGPEQDKYFADAALGPRLFDNLLAWLLEAKLRAGYLPESGAVEIALPARAEVLAVHVNGERVAAPQVRVVGSVKRVTLDVSKCRPHETLRVRISYGPLPRARNVETIIHLPWNTLQAAADSPQALAEYLQGLGATTCQPLLRDSFGKAWYRGMPEDNPDDKVVVGYAGDFLADLVRECHDRGIRVIGGIYLDNATPLRQYPGVQRRDREGQPVKDQWGRTLACFNDPRALEHNLATVDQLLQNYDLDGVMLDDNFELETNDCFCPYCREGFRAYCAREGAAYEDPAQSSAPAVQRLWRAYRQEATRDLVTRIRERTAAHHAALGGWVEVGMDATHLAGPLDLLGGMVYMSPPRAVRGPLSVVGACPYICLLWAPDTPPERMEQECREAVYAGSPVVGFWTRGDDGGYRMDDARSAAITRSFGAVESQWRAFYRDTIVTGDPRFEVTAGALTTEDLSLTLRNTGQRVAERVGGHLDLGPLE